MLKLIFSILVILFIIELINTREPYSIYVEDVCGNGLEVSKAIPNYKDKPVKKLLKSFINIDYCDNLDDLSYVSINNVDDLSHVSLSNNLADLSYVSMANNYILLDDYNSSINEGFSNVEYNIEYNMTLFEKVYLLLVGLYMIIILCKVNK